jgi:RNA polymerase sigma factor (sigma-70 family)
MDACPATAEELLSSVVSGHGHQLTRFFLSRVPEPSEAQDLVQEVYLRILRHARPNLIRCLKAYVYAIAASVAHEHWRKRAARPPHLTLDEAPEEALPVDTDTFLTTGPEAAAMTAEQVGHLSVLLDQLAPKVRAVLIWAHRDGHTYEEIGAQSSVSRNRVKKYLTKALAHCRRERGRVMGRGTEPSTGMNSTPRRFDRCR